MSPQELKRLNTRLGDVRGRNPHGQPVYRWFEARELTYPCRVSETAWEHVRQVDDDCWLIAMWQAPPSEAHWKEQFPLIGYPHQGVYYATDQMLRPGVEPNDTITDEVAGRLKHQATKTFRDFMDEIESSREKRQRDEKNTISDLVDSACTAFGNLPGARGGSVSFGGYDATIINKD